MRMWQCENVTMWESIRAEKLDFSAQLWGRKKCHKIQCQREKRKKVKNPIKWRWDKKKRFQAHQLTKAKEYIFFFMDTKI